MVLQDFSELACDRDLPFLPTFGREAIVPLSGHANGPQREVDVGPEQIHDFLFTEASHEKSREQRALPRVADSEELRKVSLPILLGQRHAALGKLKLPHDPASTVALEELGNDDDVVKNCVRLHPTLFQVNNEVVQFLGRDALERAVVKGIAESIEHGLILAVGVRFLESVDLIEMPVDERTEQAPRIGCRYWARCM